MTYMTPMGPIPPGTPDWHQADQGNLARGQYVLDTSGHGAVSYSPTTGGVRTAWNFSSRAAAEDSALAGMPSDTVVHWGHHTCLALARGQYRFGFGVQTSALRARQKAREECGEPGARVTALINTSSGRLDPATSWATGERMAGVGRAVGAMAGFNVMAFLVLLFVVAVAAIGSRVPALAFALIAAAVCSAVWWHRRDRTRA